MTLQPPMQDLVAKDMHGIEWKFRHIYRGNFKGGGGGVCFGDEGMVWL